MVYIKKGEGWFGLVSQAWNSIYKFPVEESLFLSLLQANPVLLKENLILILIVTENYEDFVYPKERCNTNPDLHLCSLW